MEKIIFENAIAELFHFFRFKDQPDESIIEIWHDKVRRIPKEALTWIVEQIEELDTMPRNLPKTMLGLHQVWMRENPDKSFRQKTNCEDCNGSGFLHFIKNEPDYIKGGMDIHFTAICASCQNWEDHLGTSRGALMITKQQLIELDFKMAYKEYPKLKGKQEVKSKRDIEKVMPFQEV
jgi:hypothetical protein